MDGPVRLKQLQILSHEYKVSLGGTRLPQAHSRTAGPSVHLAAIA